MKRVLMMLSLMFVATFMACKPEPTPEPGNGDDPVIENKKISKIYFDNGFGFGKRLDQVWIWDNEQLKKIEYYSSNNTISYEEYYTYNEKGQVSRIDNYADGEQTEYSYNGDKITKAKLYYDGELEEDWRFTYENNKITKIELVFEAKSSVKKKMNPFANLLPFETADLLYHVKNNAKNRNGFYYELTWDNDNISKIEIVEDGERADVDCKYDDKINPFNNFMSIYAEYYVEEFYGSKNNIIQMVCSFYEDGDNYNEVTNYSYSYEGDYPIVKRMNDSDLKYVWYYEYI